MNEFNPDYLIPVVDVHASFLKDTIVNSDKTKHDMIVNSDKTKHDTIVNRDKNKHDMIVNSDKTKHDMIVNSVVLKGHDRKQRQN